MALLGPLLLDVEKDIDNLRFYKPEITALITSLPITDKIALAALIKERIHLSDYFILAMLYVVVCWGLHVSVALSHLCRIERLAFHNCRKLQIFLLKFFQRNFMRLFSS